MARSYTAGESGGDQKQVTRRDSQTGEITSLRYGNLVMGAEERSEYGKFDSLPSSLKERVAAEAKWAFKNPTNYDVASSEPIPELVQPSEKRMAIAKELVEKYGGPEPELFKQLMSGKEAGLLVKRFGKDFPKVFVEAIYKADSVAERGGQSKIGESHIVAPSLYYEDDYDVSSNLFTIKSVNQGNNQFTRSVSLTKFDFANPDREFDD